MERIYNEDIKKKPPLGECPFKGSFLSDEIMTNLNIAKVDFCNPRLKGIASFDYKKNDGLYTIGVSDYRFITMWTQCGYNSIYCYNDYINKIGYNNKYEKFPTKEQLMDFDYSSRSKSLKIGEIVTLMNSQGKFAAIKILKIITKSEDINHLLEFEYKIYDDLEELSKN